MTPERWARIKDIFAAVVDLAPQERAAAVIQACHGDADLQAEVQRLVAQHDEMGPFLEGPHQSSSAFLVAPGSLLANRYRIVSLLGSGGMGEVYEAEDQELGGPVALKVVHDQLNDAALDRFRREVQLARQVTHPNVCRVFDIGYHHQQGREIVFLTMEFVAGETLSARLRWKGPLAPSEALAIAQQLCQALAAAHQAGVLHRDFKPGNVMLTGSGESIRAIVTDFGMARWLGRAKGAVGTLTTQGQIFGTPAYMSPEQLQGKELTAASDIYSLGLVLHEMVTGIRPFHDQSSMGEAVKRLTEDPPEPRELVPNLDRHWNRTVMRCLQRDPARRYATAEDVCAALHGEGKNDRFRRRYRPLYAMAVAILMAASGVFAFHDRLLWPSLPGEEHVAVLPFKFSGGDAASQATADGVAESLTQNLSRLRAPGLSFWVVPWQEVRQRPANDESHAGPALGANLLLTGQMARDEGRLHLTLDLKDANTLRVLRSGVVDVPEADAFNLDIKILEQTASMLRLQMAAGSLQPLQIRDAPAPGAYEFYEEGRGYLLRRTPEDVDQAINLLVKAVEKDPSFALAKASLAFAYEQKYRDTKEARWLVWSKEICAQALSLDEKLSAAHLAWGMLLEDSGELDAAIQSLQRALALDPANDEARNWLAVAYEQAGKLLEAETLLKETLNRNPANWIIYNNLGAFYYRHHQYNLAEPLFRSAMELAPGNPKAFSNLGGLYATQGKNKEAEAVLLQAIAIKPSAGAYNNLGTVLRSEGRYADSAHMLEKATELVPGDDRLWSNLGNAYILAGDTGKANQAYERSVQELQKALTLRPHDTQLLENLALNYANLKQKNEALLTLARVTGPPAHARDTLFSNAMVFEMVGERERALAALRAAVRAGLSSETIQNTPTFKNLRADPRYTQVVVPK
jgi:Flp pilus assembly protein TadD/TolB-like protein